MSKKFTNSSTNAIWIYSCQKHPKACTNFLHILVSMLCVFVDVIWHYNLMPVFCLPVPLLFGHIANFLFNEKKFEPCHLRKHELEIYFTQTMPTFLCLSVSLCDTVRLVRIAHKRSTTIKNKLWACEKRTHLLRCAMKFAFTHALYKWHHFHCMDRHECKLVRRKSRTDLKN